MIVLTLQLTNLLLEMFCSCMTCYHGYTAYCFHIARHAYICVTLAIIGCKHTSLSFKVCRIFAVLFFLDKGQTNLVSCCGYEGNGGYFKSHEKPRPASFVLTDMIGYSLEL